MATMWAVPMASAGVRTHGICQEACETRGVERGKMQEELLSLDWVEFVFDSGLSEGMCNFRVGNLASEPSG